MHVFLHFSYFYILRVKSIFFTLYNYIIFFNLSFFCETVTFYFYFTQTWMMDMSRSIMSYCFININFIKIFIKFVVCFHFFTFGFKELILAVIPLILVFKPARLSFKLPILSFLAIVTFLFMSLIGFTLSI